MTTALLRERTPLLEAIEKLQPHDHLCLIYGTREEQFASVIPFLRLGLERHELCVYIVDENTADTVLGALKDDGVDAAAAVESGALAIITKRDAYLKNGYFDPDLMIRFLEESVAQAESKGYAALRVTGEMTWALGPETGVERLIEYEAKLNDVFPRCQVTAICQYNRTRFSPAVIKQVILTHPYVISSGVVAKNPFFIPLQEYLTPAQPAIEVERLLKNIIDFRKSEESQQLSADRYRGLVESLSDWVWEVDEKGVYTYAGPQVRDVLGYAPEEVVGKTPFDLMPPDERERVAEMFKAAVSARKPLIAIANRNLHKDGHGVVLETSGTAILDQSGRFRGYRGIDRDVTERKRMEEALRLSEASLNRAQAVAHIGSWSLDIPKNDLRWSDETYRIFQIPSGTPMTYEKFLEKVHADDHAAVNAAWAAALEHQPYSVEHRVFADGTIKWVHERAEIEFGPDGSALRGIGTVQDVTERKLAEKSIRDQTRALDAFFRHTLTPVVFLDPKFVFIRVNDAYARACRRDVAEFPGRGHFQLYPHAENEAIFREVVRTKTPYRAVAKPFEYSDHPEWGVSYWDWTLVPILDESGEVEFLVFSLQDVTERRKAEEGLQKTLRALKTLSLCNEAVVRAVDEKDLLEKICETICHGDGFLMAWVGYRQDDERKTVRPVARAGHDEGYVDGIDVTWADEEHGRGPTGTAVRTKSVVTCPDMRTDPRMGPWREEALKRGYVSSIALPLLSGEQVLGALTIYSRAPEAFGEEEVALLKELADDLAYGIVSQRAREESFRANEEIQHLNAELEERVRMRTAQVEAANKDLEAFTYSVSHDLRAPLRSIDGFSQILMDDYAPKLDPECRRYLGLVRHGTEEMGRLIDDLLTFSRLGRQALKKITVSMDDLVRGAIETLEPQRHGRQVSFKIAPLAPCRGDSSLLKQVWVNLLSNALKFTAKRDEALIEIDSHEEEGETVYRVKDNGAGFDMRYVDKIFKVFARLHAKEEYEGTGVGLAIVARIVERHGGRVWARGEPGRGAEFFFTLDGRAS